MPITTPDEGKMIATHLTPGGITMRYSGQREQQQDMPIVVGSAIRQLGYALPF
ncbi:MAG: hypothetical protein ACXVZX_10180 [Terriglobales bacterium]